MTLECVFVCSRTISKLRSGPLGNLLDGYCDWLLDDGFSPVSIRNHLSKVSHLNSYLDEEKVGQRPLTARDIKGFFKAYRVRSHKPSEHRLRNIQWSTNRFVKYLCKRQINPIFFLPSTYGIVDFLKPTKEISHGKTNQSHQTTPQPEVLASSHQRAEQEWVESGRILQAAQQFPTQASL